MRMNVVVISPEAEEPREVPVLAALLAAGLERYHIRKPTWSAERLSDWIQGLPPEWRDRLVLHQHHHLVPELGLGGRHWRDMPGNAGGSTAPFMGQGQPRRGPITSRSCHDLDTLRGALERYDSIFFGPIYPTTSKPGYGPSGNFSPQNIADLLNRRTTAERRATVLALGGITSETAPRALALGFDGVAVLGAVWHAADPVQAFEAIRNCAGGGSAPGVTARRELSSDHAA